jgi:uncharacterized protein (DUF4415 family)
MSSVMYELVFYMQNDGIIHSHRRENLKPQILHKRFACVRLQISLEHLRASYAGWQNRI